MSEKKVIEATFVARSVEDAKNVIEAFCQEFPSLAGMPEVTSELLDYWETGLFDPAIKAAIDAHSFDDEWPGHIDLNITSRNGEEHFREVVITPYVGDRHLRFWWLEYTNGWLFEADFRERPSAYAARHIIDLAETNLKFNDPTWEVAGELKQTWELENA